MASSKATARHQARFQPSQSWLSKRWQDLPLATKGVVLNALPLTVLLASIAFIFKSEQQAALLENRVQNALQVQQDIQTVHTELLEASTGVRDYLLTGNAEFLSVYHNAKEALPKLISSLQHKLDDEAQQKLLLTIEPLVKKNLDDLTVLANNQSHEANDVLIKKFASQGNSLNQLREGLHQMSLRESRLIENDRRKVLEERQRNNRITLLAVVAGVLGSVIGILIFSRTIVGRVKLIRDSAAHLVRGEPLALPQISQDELGQLTLELDQTSKLLTQSANEAHQARIEAEEASTAKSTFLSRTSHELRTPLNAILGFAQLLENDLPAGRQKDSASLIMGAGKHLLKLINDVLDIARIESGDMSMDCHYFDLKELLEEACNFIRPLGQIRDIDIESSLPEQVTLNTDRQKLMQVILNLLSNALKYGPENSTVTLNAYVKDQQAIIEVTDQGKGIPPALRSRLFTPFDRLGAERSMTEGTGLGLVLSKQIIDAMGGSIHLADDKSMFWVSVPVAQETAKLTDSHQPSVAPNIQIKGSKQNILYVEDHASNRALIEAIIARHHHLKLHMATNLKDAMNYIHNQSPDILLLDLNLPDGSGELLIQHMQANPAYRSIPIMVLSADALPETILRLQAMGITAYFTKPLDIALFNHQLNQLIIQSNHE